MNRLRKASRSAFTLLRAVATAVLVLAFLVTSVAPTFAAGGTTGAISGTIVDAQTNAPIANATVVAASPSQRTTTTTDGRGFFSFQQLPVDTYNLSVDRPGYQTLVISGITVQGDQTVALQTQGLQKQLSTIGRVRTRTAASAVQPNQTVDQVTISGERIAQATGKAFATNVQQLALSAPGVTLTAGGNISVRGSRASDVGYQFEGVDFREPQGYGLAAGTFNGLASLQVVGGAGDATQGNVGAGVVNFTVKRGTRPAFGSLDFEARTPVYGHQFGVEYGFATPDNRFSNYTSFIGQRNNFQCGPIGTDAASNGCYTASNFSAIDDLVNNFIYRFGRDQNQSLQLLTRFRRSDTLGNYGGTAPLATGCPGTPASGAVACVPYQYYTNDPRFIAFAGSLGLAGAQFNQQVPLLNSSIPLPGSNVTPPTYADIANQNLNFLSLSYTRPLGAATSFTGRYYNWATRNQRDLSYNRVLTNPETSLVGGSVNGVNFDLTTQLGEHQTITLNGKFENTFPLRDEPSVEFGLLGANSQNIGAGTSAHSSVNFNQWLNPANTSAPISATNPCPVPTTGANGDPTACYLYSAGYAIGGAGFWGPGGVGRIPAAGVGYRGSDYQFWGLGIRDLITVNPRLRFDLGLREDGAVYKQPVNPYGQLDPSGINGVTPDNPQDSDPPTIGANVRQPQFLQPRAAVAFQITPSDSIRLGFARSVNLIPGQGFGTPWQVNIDPRLSQIAAIDTAAAPECGSGLNTVRAAATGQTTPDGNGGLGFFKCKNYANQLYWANEQIDAPDTGGQVAPTYSNTDLTYQHQFRNGYGVRVTGFYKRGFNLGTFNVLHAGPPDPATLNPSFIIYGGGSAGRERTAGVDLYLSSPDRAQGFSGFLSMTYVNSVTNVPPGTPGEETITPVYNAGAAALNSVYRVGFVSPFVARAGITYRRNGFRINPIIAYDRGYPVGEGNLAPFGGNTSFGLGASPTLNGTYADVIATNLGLANPYAGGGGGVGFKYTPNYVDPVNPGSYINPVIAANRGTAEGSTTGSLLSKPRVGADLALEYTKGRNTFGVYIANLANNKYGLSALNSGNEPTPNDRYQAVVNGVAGPQTGTVNNIIPNSTSASNVNSYNYGVRPYSLDENGRGAYIIPLTTNAVPRTYRFYYQLAL